MTLKSAATALALCPPRMVDLAAADDLTDDLVAAPVVASHAGHPAFADLARGRLAVAAVVRDRPPRPDPQPRGSVGRRLLGAAVREHVPLPVGSGRLRYLTTDWVDPNDLTRVFIDRGVRAWPAAEERDDVRSVARSVGCGRRFATASNAGDSECTSHTGPTAGVLRYARCPIHVSRSHPQFMSPV